MLFLLNARRTLKKVELKLNQLYMITGISRDKYT